MSKGTKQQYKLFNIDSIENALLVLSSLIIPVTINLRKFNQYSKEAESLLGKYKSKEFIPANEYDDIYDKTLYRQRELLRFIADHQSSSFSYIDTREIFVKKGFLKRELDANCENILKELLNIRNWSFHNAQSLMVAEKEIVMRSIPDRLAEIVEVKPQLNPVVIRYYSEYSCEYLKSFIRHNTIRNNQFKVVLEEMQKDYQSMYDTYPDAQFVMANGKISMDVQFVDFPMRFNLGCNDIDIAALSMKIQKGKYDGDNASENNI